MGSLKDSIKSLKLKRNNTRNSARKIKTEESDTAIMNDLDMNQVIENYTDYLHCRLLAIFEISNEEQPIDWPSFWEQEEKMVNRHHNVVLLKTTAVQQQHRIVSYLDGRRDRLLDFLWSVCRDAPSCAEAALYTLQQLERRETKLRKLHTAQFISSSGTLPRSD